MVVEADAWARVDGHLYVRVAYPADLSTAILGPGHAARLIVEAPVYGLAVPADQGRLQDRPWFYVRFARGATLDADFTVHWYQPAQRRELAGQRQRLTVRGLREASQKVRLPVHFTEAASKWIARHGHSGFGAFASARLQTMIGDKKASSDGSRRVRPSRTSLLDTMALMSGLTSVEEALQTDRGLALDTGLDGSNRVIPLGEVPGVSLVKHPWEKMISTLGQGTTPKVPVVEPIASIVPAEMAYLVSCELTAAKTAWQALLPTFGPLLAAPRVGGDLSQLRARYERQLMLNWDALAAKLSSATVTSVAMVTSAPYFGDGTDLSVLFHVRNVEALNAVVEAQARSAQRGLSGVAMDSVEIEGRTVRRTHSADGRIHQLRIQVGDYLVISNSLGAVRRILATADGKHPALARSGEFRYFRALYPHVPKEAGFLFLGDAFVGAVVGPRQKILQSRRMRARAALRSVGFSALLHGWLSGTPPTDLKALMAAGVLRAEDLRHHDGEEIHWSREGGARSAWGTAGTVTPHLDLEIEQITREERGAYQRFVETYQTYWKGFIDPIGVQLRVSKTGVDLHGRMMPLLRRSDYRDLIELVGDTRLALGDVSKGLRFVFAVAEQSELRQTLDTMGRALSGHRDVGLGWLGDWVMVGSSDRSGLWDAALSIGEVPSKKGTHQTRRADLRKSVLNRLPIYAAAHIRNRLGLAATLAGLKVQLSAVGMDLVNWAPTTPNGDVSVVKIEETLSQREKEEPLSVFYAIVDDVFLISLDRATLDAQIEAVRSGAVPRIAETSNTGPQATLAYHPETPKGYLNRTMLGLLEHGALSRHFDAMQAYEMLAVGLGKTSPGTVMVDADAHAYFGTVPAAPHGGQYSMGGEGLLIHSRYGDWVAPAALSIPVVESPLTAALERIGAFRMSVSFEGERLDRAMVTHLHWAR